MPDCAIGLMARFPQLGCVKTRLAADVGDDEALRIYLELLNRVVKVVYDLETFEFVRTAFVTPSEFLDQFAINYPGLDSYLFQADGDLGFRMKHALAALFSLPGVEKGILIGTDIPELDRGFIHQAASGLENHDCVFGPTYDGGYYLIGMRRVCEELFSGIEWGTTTVLPDTLRIATTAGLHVKLLPTLRDVDDIEDVKQLAATGVISMNNRQ